MNQIPPQTPDKESVKAVLDFALHEEEQLANRANWLDTKTGAVMGFVIVSIAELLGFLFLASAEGTKFKGAHPYCVAIFFMIGLIALVVATILGLMELSPMGFQYGPSTEFLAAQVHKEVEAIQAQCLDSLRVTSVANRKIIQRKAKLTKATVIFVGAALLCYAVAVALFFFSLL